MTMASGGEAEGEGEQGAPACGVLEGEFAPDGEQFDDHVEDRSGGQGANRNLIIRMNTPIRPN